MQIELKKIQVRPIFKKEEQKWIRLMKRDHYLGFNNVIGERINYVAEIDGKWIALLSWACSALSIKDRDKWIGWSKEKRLERLSYIANNWRFLISPKVKVKNLASHILSKNLKRLSNDWEEKYGHSIFMVETFVDSEMYKGTCYKADNWILVGETKGYSKNHQKYIYHGRKKNIFLKPLLKNARQMLGSSYTDIIFIPKNLRRRRIVDINKIKIFGPNGLIEFCKSLVDNRSPHGKRYKFESLMALCILAVLSGARGYKGIYIWGKSLEKQTLWELKLRRAPSESTIRRFILSVDADQVDHELTKWLLKQESLKGLALALDGKVLRGSRDGKKKPIELLSVVSHESALIFNQEKVESKTNEIPVAQDILKNLPIEGSVITADALHSQDETATIIARDKKANFVFTIKNNRSKIKNEIEEALSKSAFSPSKV